MTKLAIAAVLLSSLFAAAQNPVSDAARNTFTGRSKNLLGAAEEMPADKYSFKPTEAQRTFAGWVQHTVEMNNGACAKLTDATAPKTEVKEEDGKDKLVAALKQSFEFCTAQLPKLQDAKLGDEVASGEKKATKAAVLLGLMGGYADHYGQMATYLRLNGHLPPTAKK
jgi:uncharacterized damage-inducible protein DinB